MLTQHRSASAALLTACGTLKLFELQSCLLHVGHDMTGDVYSWLLCNGSLQLLLCWLLWCTCDSGDSLLQLYVLDTSWSAIDIVEPCSAHCFA
jgi:hypothetical protein